MTIIQALMGSAQQSGQGSGDMLGSLMGQVLGGANTSGASSGGTEQGLDLNDLLGAGMNFMAAKQSGKSDIEALTGVLMSGSSMAQTPHRAQSGEVVTSALLGALTSMMKK